MIDHILKDFFLCFCKRNIIAKHVTTNLDHTTIKNINAQQFHDSLSIFTRITAWTDKQTDNQSIILKHIEML